MPSYLLVELGHPVSLRRDPFRTRGRQRYLTDVLIELSMHPYPIKESTVGSFGVLLILFGVRQLLRESRWNHPLQRLSLP